MTKEQQIEEELIRKLTDLKYTYRPDIRTKSALELNFREKFEALNRVKLTDAEFDKLLIEIINPDVFKSSNHLRKRNTFIREDDTPLHYTLVNIKDWCKNDFEVINQLRINTESSNHRYDVILLINGVPVVQIELKTLEISPNRAMQQIVDYKNDIGNGYTNSLMCYMQLFIVSNKTRTFYFSNNNNKHFAFNADEQFLPVYTLAKEDNYKINHLDDFTDKFLSKCTLGEMISRYMVLVETEQKILVMRPYQIYAVKAIVDCIEQDRGNGYIWHTTGSGKTLTSFKASTLLKDNDDIEKCLFVVDRKDLDRQTREEFNKFQEGSVEENTNTETLVRRMLSTDYSDKVIVTTIQKLGLALNQNSSRNLKRKEEKKVTYYDRLESLRDKRVVFIFDECHRSQFGDNHDAIKEFFPKAQLFGFTGTPIFEENATYKTIEGKTASYKTTKDVFQKELHAYTITNAIEDKNVLRFHIDYFKPEKKASVGDDLHKLAVTKAILEKHYKATDYKRFNALLATASINDAIQYYHTFKKLQAEKLQENQDYKPLQIACVFSPPAEGNKDIQQLQDDLNQEKEDNKVEPDKKKEALNTIIEDYNKQYNTNHRITDFDLYYQDVQQRIKNQKYTNADYAHENKIDVMIVVDMLLTGFDSKYLNTLYVDKNLKYHGLIQAYSRTNRVINDTKPYGNILVFRDQEEEVNKAMIRFSGAKIEKAKEIWLVDAAPKVIAKYKDAVEQLNQFMEAKGLDCSPSEVSNLKGDEARAGFINAFKEVQRYKTQLDQYTDLEEEQAETIEALLPTDDLRSFKSVYIDTAKRLQAEQNKQGDQAPEDVQQLDFEFVLFSSAVIDYDYIIGLIAKYTQDKPSKHKMTREELINLLGSSANLMDEREDIIAYINSLKVGAGLDEKEIRTGYQKFKEEKSAKEIQTIADKHSITVESLNSFINEIMNRMIFDGEKLTDLLEPLELGWKDRSVKEKGLMDDLVPLLNKLAQGREIAGLNAYE
ncbi:type I restriction-modification system, restrict ion subunit R [Formosa agariphila KMM 3901]|uniref:Type I restriction enzyme endonuclease subunit n=1 Tax=Formosa agariphila (strain DSM 15362 / KCTC 12365 / LMG 23005 / KMM 3901 / M-2Alg 35-1) TaxID=1347342 RepID=T2KQR3_FORAG|nr:type I restriction endonuclease subunit R [Formosa agariphila]CDF80309.1 type I restriction-modification system, restrict ion subunit R [Formosa agariphila KMM 3901]